MSKVVHPFAHRLGILRDWRHRWFADGAQYQAFLKADILLREYLQKELRGMYIGALEIERNEKMLRVIVKTSRPGMIIGRSGEGSAKLRTKIINFLNKLDKNSLVSQNNKLDVKLDIEEIRSPESNAAIVGYMIVEGLEKRMAFRRVMKQTIEKVMANRDVQGVRICLSGMLGGGSMSRTEELKKGRVPLQTFRSDIDFAKERANLPLGVIGVKVWIYRGEVFADKAKEKNK
jgi:small subunit ribosomal protein S3